MQLADIAALASRCRQAGTALVVDNTMASPMLQRPFEHGADFVMHSTTKFLSGHSDVIGGALLTRDAAHPRWQQCIEMRKLGGAIPSPFDCWLLLRSVGTLSLRVARQVDNAEAIVDWLQAHPRVERVLYPGLPDHPGHDIAARQMQRPGAMLSFLVAADEAGTARFMSRLALIVRATSLGAIHTLAEHRAVVEGPTSTTPRNLVRLSLGIEALADIQADLSQALG
jgi:cystathionine gamma-synthase